MQKVVRTLLSVALAIGVVSATRSSAQDRRPNPGAVFVMTNAADRNEVISFRNCKISLISNELPSVDCLRGWKPIEDALVLHQFFGFCGASLRGKI